METNVLEGGGKKGMELALSGCVEPGDLNKNQRDQEIFAAEIWRTSMAKKSYVEKTQRSIIVAAKSSAARIQRIAVKAATAAAIAAAEAAVQAVLKSMIGRESQRRMVAKGSGRRTRRNPARNASKSKKTLRRAA